MVLDRISTGLSGPPRLSGVVLALVNMVPVIGVIVWGWSVFEIVILYWVENVIVGALNIPRLLLAGGEGAGETRILSGKKAFLVLFFTVHYGFFCLIHGFFVFALLGEKEFWDSPLVILPKMLGEIGGMMGWAIFFLILSHLFSFFWNYIGQREYRGAIPAAQMFQPYGRIVILHITILLGAFAIEMLGAPLLLLIVLIAGKTALDLGFHLFSHAKVNEDMLPST